MLSRRIICSVAGKTNPVCHIGYVAHKSLVFQQALRFASSTSTTPPPHPTTPQQSHHSSPSSSQPQQTQILSHHANTAARIVENNIQQPETWPNTAPHHAHTTQSPKTAISTTSLTSEKDQNPIPLHTNPDIHVPGRSSVHPDHQRIVNAPPPSEQGKVVERPSLVSRIFNREKLDGLLKYGKVALVAYTTLYIVPAVAVYSLIKTGYLDLQAVVQVLPNKAQEYAATKMQSDWAPFIAAWLSTEILEPVRLPLVLGVGWLWNRRNSSYQVLRQDSPNSRKTKTKPDVSEQKLSTEQPSTEQKPSDEQHKLQKNVDNSVIKS
eukprot:TRINITY_DN5638_c0_g1_i1.p1 TRINITY_DN5638_c0_g1~~TRINITY_DN5638_c0_g1_i1.p1  ORF type:complete len:322 (+),score=86.09 TRINITY_DN5638_c0_g1_i1:45-1010(+)